MGLMIKNRKLKKVSMINSMNEADFVPERFSKVKFEDIPKDIVDKIQKMHETKKGLFLF